MLGMVGILICAFIAAIPRFSPHTIPLTKTNSGYDVCVDVNGRTVSVGIDSGAVNLGISLNKETLQEIHAIKTDKTTRFFNLRGEIFNYPTWNVSSLAFAGYHYKDVGIMQYRCWGTVSEGTDKEKSVGVIGLAFFKNKRFVFDFKAETLQFVDSFDAASSQKFIPIHLTKSGIEFTITIAGKKLKALLDTGSSVSFIRPNSVPNDIPVFWCDFFNLSEPQKGVNFIEVSAGELCCEKKNRMFVYDFKQPDVDVIVGMNSLEGMSVALDFIDFRMCITEKIREPS